MLCCGEFHTNYLKACSAHTAIAGDEGIGHRSRRTRLARDPASLAFARSGFRFPITLHILYSKAIKAFSQTVAGDEGIEPPTTVLETVVIPLN